MRKRYFVYEMTSDQYGEVENGKIISRDRILRYVDNQDNDGYSTQAKAEKFIRDSVKYDKLDKHSRYTILPTYNYIR